MSSVTKLIVNCRACTKDIVVLIEKKFNSITFQNDTVCKWEIPCIKHANNEQKCPLDLPKTIANIVDKNNYLNR